MKFNIKSSIFGPTEGYLSTEITSYPIKSKLFLLNTKGRQKYSGTNSQFRANVTRGQWPYRPAATRAMRNRHVILYDLNYLEISNTNYPSIHVHIASMASWSMAASKQPWSSYNLRFEISNCEYPGIHVHIVSNGLRGHGGLQTSEVIWPRFEISNLDYPGIHVQLASNDFRGHGGLQTASEVIWPLIWHQQPWLPWYPCAYYIQWPPTASEASTQPQRSHLTSNFNSVTWITFFHVSFASKGLHDLNEDAEIYHPLTCVASPQVTAIPALNREFVPQYFCHRVNVFYKGQPIKDARQNFFKIRDRA